MPLKKKGKKKKKKKKVVIEPTRFKTYTFVSYSNIDRSPLCAGLLQLYLKGSPVPPELGVTVKNFGTSFLHYGELPHPSAQKTARKHGFDISQNHSHIGTKIDISTSTVIICFDEYSFFFRVISYSEDVRGIEDLKARYGMNGGLTPIKLISEYFPPSSNLPREVPDFYYCKDTDEGAEQVYQMMLAAMPAIYQEIVAKPKRELI